MPLKLFALLVLSFLLFSCNTDQKTSAQQPGVNISTPRPQATPRPLADNTPKEIRLMLENAEEQTRVTKTYDPAYVVLDYPNGDVPPEKGVCTDVVIRALRKAGVDLQKLVHEDMSANFSVYPQKWGLKKADPNIDHRRVPNLNMFFTRKGKALPITDKAENYRPGDIVSWDLNGAGLTHIGIVSNLWNERTKRYLIIHNIGRGTEAEDVLFDWKITGHFRYF